jgi:NRPS condensation-like uncharacterized protein
MTGTAPGVSARPGSIPSRPFTIIDEVTCYFDTASEPANIHLELRVPFRLDHRAFRAAALAALAANPRACSRRARRSPLRRSYTWERPATFDLDPVSFAAFTDADDLVAKRAAFIARSPSIDMSPPATLLLASGPDCAHVILNAHHSTMDGLSWLELLRDIARRYRADCADGSEAGPAIAQPAADPPAGPAAVGPATAPAPPTHAPARSRLPRRPARIAPDGGGQRGVGTCLVLLPGIPAVRAAAARPGPTVNDALVTALIVAIGRWNAGHGRPARPVRITVPVNARAAGEQAAGHLSRLVTVSAVPPAPGAELGPVLLDVARQTRIARDQPGTQVGPGIRIMAAAWCPAPVKRWLVRVALHTVGPLVCDTAMLTNLGNVTDPPDFGGADAVTMAFSGTAQMPRGISVAAITAGSRLQLSVRYNRRLLSDEAAARFTRAYLGALGELTTPGDAIAAARGSRGIDSWQAAAAEPARSR